MAARSIQSVVSSLEAEKGTEEINQSISVRAFLRPQGGTDEPCPPKVRLGLARTSADHRTMGRGLFTAAPVPEPLAPPETAGDQLDIAIPTFDNIVMRPQPEAIRERGEPCRLERHIEPRIGAKARLSPHPRLPLEVLVDVKVEWVDDLVPDGLDVLRVRKRADAGVVTRLEDELDPTHVGAIVVPEPAAAEDDGAFGLDIGFAMREGDTARRR